MTGLTISFPLELRISDPECGYVTPPVGLGCAPVPCPFLTRGPWQVRPWLRQLTAPDGPRDCLPVGLHCHPPPTRYTGRFPRGRTRRASFFGSKWSRPPTVSICENRNDHFLGTYRVPGFTKGPQALTAPRREQFLAQGHPACEWRGWDSNADLQDSALVSWGGCDQWSRTRPLKQQKSLVPQRGGLRPEAEMSAGPVPLGDSEAGPSSPPPALLGV